MNQEYIIDKILRNQALSEVELTWWTENKDNNDVEEDFQFLTEMKNPLSVENKKLLKSQLKSFEKSSNPIVVQQRSNEGKIFNLRPWIALVATLLVLIVSVFVLRNNRSANHFNEYFEPYPSIVNPIVKGSQESGTKLDQVMESYQNDNYQFVIDEMASITPSNDTLSFYYANALMSMHRSEEALSIFIDLQKIENRFSKEAGWYEALSQLKLDRIQEVKIKLDGIAQDEEHPYYKEAQNLLRDIK